MQPEPTLANHLLVLRAQLGERVALHQLHARWNPALLRYLRTLAGDQAPGVAQDVWLTVLQKLSSLEQPEAFAGWLYRIAHNRAMSRRRRTRTVQPSALASGGSEASLFESLLEPVRSASGSLDDLDLVRYGFSELGPKHREVLALRYFNDLSYDDIAHVIGRSVGTVRSRLHHAKQELQRSIEREMNR